MPYGYVSQIARLQAINTKELLVKNLQTTSIILQKLQFELSGFGLCPTEWFIQFKDSDTAIIQNKKEKDFSFTGKLKESKQDWQSLILESF